jgi:hypothetical protein
MTQVRYGKSIATETPAGGISGVLCKSVVDGRVIFFFRITTENGEMQDYELRHDDLNITISPGDLASLYQLDTGHQVLNHSSVVLGLTSLELNE